MKQVVDENKAAQMLCLSVQTLRNWRHQKRGPAYLKISRSVRYKTEDLEAFINSSRIDSERSA